MGIKSRARVKIDNEARRAANKAALIAYKQRPCADCGVEYPHYVMDLDHRPGVEKEFEISGKYWKGRAAFLAELAKCDVVCANCHRVRTHTREGAYGPRA